MPNLTRDQCHRYLRLPDELVASLPLVSRSDHVQAGCGPEEYECGCIAIPFLATEPCALPFEMRLAIACGLDTCERGSARDHSHSSEEKEHAGQ